jgi:hypothetical protein
MCKSWISVLNEMPKRSLRTSITDPNVGSGVVSRVWEIQCIKRVTMA